MTTMTSTPALNPVPKSWGDNADPECPWGEPTLETPYFDYRPSVAPATDTQELQP